MDFLASTHPDINKRSANPIFIYSIAIALALCHVFYMYPVDFLLGKAQFFAEGDALQHASGWLFFKNDEWRFPLLKTIRLNYPDGANIAFTDSIPLLALPMKLIARWLPADFHYIGLWHAIAYVIDACGATFLIRALGVRSIFGAVVAIFFALSWPAMLYRLGHTSLTTHGLILFSLGLYFRGMERQPAPAYVAGGFLLVTTLALLIHPYLLAMCYVIFLAYLLDKTFSGVPLKAQIKILAASLISLVILAACLGYIGNGARAGGFDIFSMNLLAPFCYGQFWQCKIDGTGGQGEGFNYLGAGFLLILLPAFLLFGYKSLRNIKDHKALFACCVLLVFYALSTKIYAAQHLIFEYSLPRIANLIIGTFRVSGRFFWVVSYTALFVVLASLLRSRRMYLNVIVALALALQLFDVNPLREIIRMQTHRLRTEDLSAWQDLLQDIEHINVFPVWMCGTTDMAFQLHLQGIAARFGKTINSGYVARANNNCAEKHRIFDADFLPGNIYVTPKSNFQDSGPLPKGFQKAIDANLCGALDDNTIVCKAPAASAPD